MSVQVISNSSEYLKIRHLSSTVVAKLKESYYTSSNIRAIFKLPSNIYTMHKKPEAIKYGWASEQKCLVRFGVLGGGVYKDCFFWDVMLCSLVDRCAASIFRALFYPEDGGTMFFWDTGVCLHSYMTSHSKSKQFSTSLHLQGALYNHLLLIVPYNILLCDYFYSHLVWW